MFLIRYSQWVLKKLTRWNWLHKVRVWHSWSNLAFFTGLGNDVCLLFVKSEKTLPVQILLNVVYVMATLQVSDNACPNIRPIFPRIVSEICTILFFTNVSCFILVPSSHFTSYKYECLQLFTSAITAAWHDLACVSKSPWAALETSAFAIWLVFFFYRGRLSVRSCLPGLSGYLMSFYRHLSFSREGAW